MQVEGLEQLDRLVEIVVAVEDRDLPAFGLAGAPLRVPGRHLTSARRQPFHGFGPVLLAVTGAAGNRLGGRHFLSIGRPRTDGRTATGAGSGVGSIGRQADRACPHRECRLGGTRKRWSFPAGSDRDRIRDERGSLRTRNRRCPQSRRNHHGCRGSRAVQERARSSAAMSLAVV